ncbi:potassium voltage-gated channel subfamily S member 3-like [Chiloscyllium plagiosum]|uniref:potassium voltage-gated channel subfamily S member 3-like n=1 Tax=Chiloscyllium plagiosum TaxID=36176 RepID=UPI001CB81475|nr:potassium voltage-gated channel subfamily S member 3-like [Chiloscyllium plagiosum]XP_043573911.1 potassium voltage-gated channel subfamily S member 3-like [Chiloscyllium plagiosum]XP_043573912.1 potassium voltage-gated channel subfamily S member 3-like [Chiloscyllium plagiosum]XP_043573913.1 potassium voltage-gated channel subfamily S member 3-like [Chiloscyllium plagiosum]XP_043573914.1 potassium voltage-gated channel subfamily S member 3-like [Chiloscyllium plagiosum]
MVYGQFYHRDRLYLKMINVNVGGLKQKVDQKVLLKFPETRLGKLLRCSSKEDTLELCDDYDVHTDEYYFDRNPSFFHYVLNFYSTGKLHVMEGICIFSFNQEIEYWGLGGISIHHCCRFKYHERKENIVEKEFDTQSDELSLTSSEDASTIPQQIESFKHMWCGKQREKLWLILENPEYSFAAKVFTISSLAIVLLSIVTMCVHSLPEFQEQQEGLGFLIVESTCIAWFSFEYIARLIVAPYICKFLQNPLNIIDFLSFLPFYLTLVVERIDDESSELVNIGRVVQVLRLMRIFRVLKLARHSIGLRSLGATFRHSYEEVGLLIVFLTVGIAIFSALIYSSEKDEKETGLHSIPIGWWWATISMTTVGYGDTYPVTIQGKLIGSTCIIFGLLMVALPVSVIFNRFSKYYRREQAIDVVIRNQELRKLAAGLPCVNIRDIYVKKMRYHSKTNTVDQNSVCCEKQSSKVSSINHNIDTEQCPRNN